MFPFEKMRSFIFLKISSFFTENLVRKRILFICFPCIAHNPKLKHDTLFEQSKIADDIVFLEL